MRITGLEIRWIKMAGGLPAPVNIGVRDFATKRNMKPHSLRLLTAAAILSAVSAPAATLTVTSAADAGGTCPGANCTLRQAIATAGAGDTINLSRLAS